MATKNDIFSITERYLSKKYEFRRNTVSFEVEIREKNETEQDVNIWKHTNLNDLYVELQKAGVLITEAKLKALLKSRWVQDYNPFLAYFESLEGDAESDYILKFCEYVECGTPDEWFEFLDEFTKTLIRCVACSLGKAFNKQCFVMVSPVQNIGKTSFIKFLCPPEFQDYYTEEMSFDKDGLIALSSNFIINLDELSVIAKSDLNTLKTYFSKDSIKVRLPYEAKASTAKRLCNFFASTNNEDFLNDPTGSVRWVAFYIKNINFAYSKNIDIDKIWYQAYQLYLSGKTGKLNQKDIEQNEKRNTKFTKITNEMEFIQKYCTPDPDKVFFYTVTEIQEKLTKFNTTKINTPNISKALQALGYKRVSKRTETRDFPVYGYYLKFEGDEPPTIYSSESSFV
jgi:predicted P-loop ATPase